MKIQWVTGPIPDVHTVNREDHGLPMFDLVTRYDILSNGVLWSFLPGLTTDHNSVPLFARRLYYPSDIELQAGGFVHDQLYRAGAPREWSDDFYRSIIEHSMMERAGGNKFKRANAVIQSRILWAAVRIGGQGPYNRNSEDTHQKTRALILRNNQSLPVVGWL